MNTNQTSCVLSSLYKIFPEDSIPQTSFSGFSMLKNEKSSFQLVFDAKKGDRFSLEIESPLKEYLHISYVKMIPAGLTAPKFSDDYYLNKKKKAYPDLLVPIESTEAAALYDGLNTLWLEIKAKDTLPVGVHTINLFLTVNGIEFENTLTVEVIDAKLPKQDFIFTNWFHTDCLMSHYNFTVFSDEYWRVTENYLRRAVEYGMNCVLTPLFTPPLDTKIGGERPTVQLVDVEVTGKNAYTFGFKNLERWLAMCEKVGIEYYEMSHLFTQWGAKHAPKIVAKVNGKEEKIFGWKTRTTSKKYKLFLAQFAKALTAFIDERGIREKCLFHVSDEPNGSMIRGYKKASKIVHDNFPGFKIIDALSDYKIYQKGLIETPIPANDHVKAFIGNVPELWTYYCCSQGSKYVSNRFFSMPSQRNRVLGYQLYKFDVKGFLHWGYNFYYLQYSKGLIDPYKVTDAGGGFSSGDAFVVYPKADGTPLDSLRLHVFYDAFQDKMALELLESKIGKEKTMALLEADTKQPITFSEYPHSDEWQLATREKINIAIKATL